MVGAEVPTEIIPSKYRSYFENQESGCTMFMIFFDDTTSSDGTMAAIQELRNIAGTRKESINSASTILVRTAAITTYAIVSCCVMFFVSVTTLC